MREVRGIGPRTNIRYWLVVAAWIMTAAAYFWFAANIAVYMILDFTLGESWPDVLASGYWWMVTAGSLVIGALVAMEMHRIMQSGRRGTDNVGVLGLIIANLVVAGFVSEAVRGTFEPARMIEGAAGVLAVVIFVALVVFWIACAVDVLGSSNRE